MNTEAAKDKFYESEAERDETENLETGFYSDFGDRLSSPESEPLPLYGPPTTNRRQLPALKTISSISAGTSPVMSPRHLPSIKRCSLSSFEAVRRDISEEVAEKLVNKLIVPPRSRIAKNLHSPPRNRRKTSTPNIYASGFSSIKSDDFGRRFND